MRVLDIVKTNEGLLAIVTKVKQAHGGWPRSCCIEYIKGQDTKGKDMIVAWLEDKDILVIDSIGQIVQRNGE